MCIVHTILNGILYKLSLAYLYRTLFLFLLCLSLSHNNSPSSPPEHWSVWFVWTEPQLSFVDPTILGEGLYSVLRTLSWVLRTWAQDCRDCGADPDNFHLWKLQHRLTVCTSFCRSFWLGKFLPIDHVWFYLIIYLSEYLSFFRRLHVYHKK